jgi:hypothetical protein
MLVALLLGAWSTWSYTLRCTTCSATAQLVEQQFLGFPFSPRRSEPRPGAQYERLFGRPCKHVFRRVGFARNTHLLLGMVTVCGVTSEGVMLHGRMEAVQALYRLDLRLPNQELAAKTLALIDRLVAPDAQGNDLRHALRRSGDTLLELAQRLDRVQTVEQWQDVLRCAQENFRHSPELPDA